MIDLHIHSTFSDGSDTLEQIVEKANELQLNTISITDHNKCLAYLKKNARLFKHFAGKVITGCEFTVRYKNVIIEILAYGYDVKPIARYIKHTYPTFKQDKLRRLYLTIETLKEKNIAFNQKQLMHNVKLGSMSQAVLKEMLADERNLKYLTGEIPDKRVFLRHYLNNPNHELYINFSVLYPTIKEVVDKIHQAGGICFLAHPFEYALDIKQELPHILEEGKIDGLECYYPTFSCEQTNYLLNYCNSHSLKISGGTDYHGQNRSKNQLGTGINNNFHLEQEQIEWLTTIPKFKP